MIKNISITSLIILSLICSSSSIAMPFDLKIGSINLPPGFSLQKNINKKHNNSVFEFYKNNIETTSKTYFSISVFNYKVHNINLSEVPIEKATLSFLHDATVTYKNKYPVTKTYKPRMITINNKLSAFTLLDIGSGKNLYIGVIATSIMNDQVLTFTAIIPNEVQPDQLVKILDSISGYKNKI